MGGRTQSTLVLLRALMKKQVVLYGVCFSYLFIYLFFYCAVCVFSLIFWWKAFCEVWPWFRHILPITLITQKWFPFCCPTLNCYANALQCQNTINHFSQSKYIPFPWRLIIVLCLSVSAHARLKYRCSFSSVLINVYSLVLPIHPTPHPHPHRRQSHCDRRLQHLAAGGFNGLRESPLLDRSAAADDRAHW